MHHDEDTTDDPDSEIIYKATHMRTRPRGCAQGHVDSQEATWMRTRPRGSEDGPPVSLTSLGLLLPLRSVSLLISCVYPSANSFLSTALHFPLY